MYFVLEIDTGRTHKLDCFFFFVHEETRPTQQLRTREELTHLTAAVCYPPFPLSGSWCLYSAWRCSLLANRGTVRLNTKSRPHDE